MAEVLYVEPSEGWRVPQGYRPITLTVVNDQCEIKAALERCGQSNVAFVVPEELRPDKTTYLWAYDHKNMWPIPAQIKPTGEVIVGSNVDGVVI